MWEYTQKRSPLNVLNVLDHFGNKVICDYIWERTPARNLTPDRDQRNRTDIDAGLMWRTNGKTNDAGLTFLRYSGISIFDSVKM
jgi:hypothetical protein